MRGRFSDAETLNTPNPTGGTRCLEIDDLVAMVEGSLSTERGEVVLAHVDRCAACAEVIANLGSLEGPERRIGRYQIEKLLGSGGMGIVYAAFDPELQRRVAIKLVRPDTTSDALQALMIKEARTLARLSHPNIVAVFDVGKHDDEVYFATELVDGTTLDTWQKQRTRDEIVGAWIQVARGLAAAHAAGIVHRDVKPANVLVGRDGRARIGDFGIAYRATAGDSLEPLSTDLVAGTPAYMAPEQKSGAVDARSDQFSTAVGLAEALTGTRPSAGDAVVVEPLALATALTRALAHDPAARFPTMNELADALAAAIAPPPRSRVKWIAAAAVASAAVATGVVLLALGGGDETCRAPEVPPRVWSPARRAELAKRVPSDLGPAIENFLARWTAAANEVCSGKDAALRRLRTRCLEQQLGKLDTLLTGWEAEPPRRAFKAMLALDALPHPSWCSEANVALVRVPTPEQREEIAAVEDLLDAIEGNSRAEIAKAEALLRRARATSYVPLVRVASRQLASMQRGDRAAQIATLRAAAAEGPDDFSKVYAMNDLVGVLGADQLAEAEQLAANARALIARLGGDPILEAEVDFRIASVLGTSERVADAITALERARHLMATAYGATSVQVGNVLVALGGVYYARDGITSKPAREATMAADAIWKQHAIPMPSALIAITVPEMLEQAKNLNLLGLEFYGAKSEAAFSGAFALMQAYDIAEQRPEAIAYGRRADTLGKELGLKISRVPYVRGQLARLLLDDGKVDEAVTLAGEAVALAQSMGLEEELATARAVLGRALLAAGRKAEARKPLEDALAFNMRTNASPRFRARVRFTLAQVTGDADEARVARSEALAFKSTPDADIVKSPVGAPHLLRETDRLVAKIDAWLATHK